MGADDDRRLVQVGGAALAHYLRGDETSAAAVIAELSDDPQVILDVFARFAVVVGEALASVRGVDLCVVLADLEAPVVKPIAGAPVKRSAAVGFIVGLATGDDEAIARGIDQFADLATGISSLFELSLTLLGSLADGHDPAEIASRIAVLGSIPPAEGA